MNCYQTAQFCPDGRAEIIVTDIINTGSYTIVEELIHVVGLDGDLSEELDFEVVSDTEIVDPWSTTWQLDTEGTLAFSCP